MLRSWDIKGGGETTVGRPYGSQKETTYLEGVPNFQKHPRTALRRDVVWGTETSTSVYLNGFSSKHSPRQAQRPKAGNRRGVPSIDRPNKAQGQVRRLGPPARFPFTPFLGKGSSTKIDCRKKGPNCSNLSTGGPRVGLFVSRACQSEQLGLRPKANYRLGGDFDDSK